MSENPDKFDAEDIAFTIQDFLNTNPVFVGDGWNAEANDLGEIDIFVPGETQKFRLVIEEIEADDD